MGSYPFALCLAAPGDLRQVRGLVREAAEWLRTTKVTDQWARPWPSRAGQEERMLDDLLKGKTWLLWDGERSVATITVDPEEPLDERRLPVWPARKRGRAVYVRRVVVGRSYAGQGIGAALLDWAASLARRKHKARLIRIDVWTTNVQLHAYYEKQGFTRCAGRDPGDLTNYPSQALFERPVSRRGSGYVKLFVEKRTRAAARPDDQSRPQP